METCDRCDDRYQLSEMLIVDDEKVCPECNEPADRIV